MDDRFQNEVAGAALVLLASEPWDALSPDKIARQAGLPLRKVEKDFPCPSDLIPAIVGWVEAQKKAAPPDSAASPVDVLFESLMNRFEAMDAFKGSFVSLAETIRRRPPEAFAFYRSLRPFLIESLSLSQPKEAKKPSEAQVACLAGAYVFAFFRWADDETPDLRHTMASLDSTLKSCKIFLFHTLNF